MLRVYDSQRCQTPLESIKRGKQNMSVSCEEHARRLKMDVFN